MVKLDLVRRANRELVATKPFVAVVAGGTNGIGEATVRALAANFADNGDGLRVYIVGRKQTAADKIIADCTRICAKGRFVFLKADLSRLKETDRVCDEIAQREEKEAATANVTPKIDFILLSQGIISFTLEDTEEGIDKYFTLMYLSRMRFPVKLMPLLANAPLGGHVVSVLNAGVKPKIQLDDIAMQKPESSKFSVAFGHVGGVMNVFMDELARRNPGKISMCHSYPGFVKTDGATNSNLPWWAKLIARFLVALWPFHIPIAEAGERMLFMATPRFPSKTTGAAAGTATTGVEGLAIAEGLDGSVGSGAYRVTDLGEIYHLGKEYARLRENGGADKVWKDTHEIFEAIEAHGVFKK